MNQAPILWQHQKDAVLRGMSSNNTLLSHVVGGGKTFTMAATGPKMKQAGLVLPVRNLRRSRDKSSSAATSSRACG
jgi:N12 class adenine-specific DNA methylase